MVEHFPEDVLERSDDPRLREAALQLFGAARIPRGYEVAVILVERVADVDQQLAAELSAMAVEQIEQAVADENRGQDRRGTEGIRIAAADERRDVARLRDG